MATGKKTFIFYSDWINMVREMPDKDAGELLKHILSYVNGEKPKTDNVLVRMAFGHMMPILEDDLKRWKLTREKRKQAGAKGGKQRQANAKQMLEDAKQVQPVNDNVNVSTNVDDILRPYNQFIEEVKKGEHQIVVESWLMKFKIPPHVLTDILRVDFKTQLLTDNKVHKSTLDIRQHFFNFINTYERMGKLKEYRNNAV